MSLCRLFYAAFLQCLQCGNRKKTVFSNLGALTHMSKTVTPVSNLVVQLHFFCLLQHAHLLCTTLVLCLPLRGKKKQKTKREKCVHYIFWFHDGCFLYCSSICLHRWQHYFHTANPISHAVTCCVLNCIACICVNIGLY